MPNTQPHSTSAKRTGPAQEPVEALGQSEAFIEFQERLSRAAQVQRPVLLLGERGTGKELAAIRLHYLSRRWQGPLVSLNCAALVPALLESELFGHEAGAFTGAQSRRVGRFEAADGGTLFLDEIGAIPLEVQEKILRVVEYGVFERVGSSVAVDADVRIIGATHADLAEMARRQRFKQDLLDRLSFEVLYLPPLRERIGDVMLLADHFARRMAYELGWEEMPVFSPEVIGTLERHPWHGNIRELKNVVERAVYRSESAVIGEIVLDPFRKGFLARSAKKDAESIPGGGTPAPSGLSGLDTLPLKTAVQRLEIFMLKKALVAVCHNQRKAAGLLGLTYDQLRGLLRKHRDRL